MSKPTDRRGFISAALGAAGAGALCGVQHGCLRAVPSEEPAATPATPAQPVQPADGLPCGRIGKIEISRLIMGGNLIGGWAHSRDLIYVARLLKAYNTEQKVFETLELAEQSGINTIHVDPSCLAIVRKYRRQRGGKIQAMVCIDEQDVLTQAKRLIDGGATLLYTDGEFSDCEVMAGRVEKLGKALDAIRQQGVPAGIGGHSLETPMACEKNGLNPDFYVKTFHLDSYWSAPPKEHREEWCWYKSTTTDHNKYYDNIWCLDYEKTAAFFQQVEKPWIAFKVLAAGAIHPRTGFSAAFRHGADFIMVGMFDFQVEQNVQIAKEAVGKMQDRKRPWRA